VRYDFTDSDQDFSLTRDVGAGDVVFGTVVHQADSGTILCSPYDTVAGRTLNGVVSPVVSIDAASYDFVRVRVKTGSGPVPNPNQSYVGQMYWRTSSGAYPYSARSETNPDWFQMGEPYQLLTWGLRGEDDWAGTITGLYWVFFSDVTTSGVFEIDYVRVEEE